MKSRQLMLSSLILLVAACDSSGSRSGTTAPTGIAQQGPVTRSLSGQVFELIPGTRVSAAGIPLTVVVVSVSGCSPPCVLTHNWTYRSTTSGADGRYTFPDLPDGSATILAGAANYRQVCGAGVELGATTIIDVEITSDANPQPSPTMPPLTVTGQVYEITPAGRVGISGAWVGLEHHAPDAPFLTVFSGADGRYAACGIPSDWALAFWAGRTGYSDTYVWHRFSADSTVDIELKRQ